jgi:hypothetical protein
METRTYADLFELVESLCGVSFAAIETARIKALINRRATKAYRSSSYWPRYLNIGEARAVTSSVIPYTEGVLSEIDTFLRIHRTEPFISSQAQEFAFMVTSAGARIIAGDLDATSAFVTYKARHTAIYGTGGSDTATVPKEWFDYIAHGTYADYLRAEGQQEKAALADAEAADILTDELLRIDEQGTTQLVAMRVNTNSNMQTRN